MTKGQGVYTVNMLNKAMIHVPGRMHQDGVRFYHATQNSMQFKPYELFISGIFCSVFLDCGWLQVTKTAECETTGKGGLLYILVKIFKFSVFRMQNLIKKKELTRKVIKMNMKF